MAILLPDTTPDCRTVRLKTFPDERGWLTCADACTDIPFPVKRLFWIYNVPEEATRGGHANWKCAEAIFPLKGSFDIYVDDGRQHATLHMDQPDTGIIIPAGVWCLLSKFEEGTICLVASDEPYCQEAYVNDYQDFLEQTICRQ